MRRSLLVGCAGILVMGCSGKLEPIVRPAGPGDAGNSGMPDAASVTPRELDGGATIDPTREGGAVGRPDAGRDAVFAEVPPDTDEIWPTTVVNVGYGCEADQWCWENPSPQGDAVFASTALSPTDVWAVGGYGLAMRWDGTAWQRTDTGGTGNIWSVWGSSASDVWAIQDTQSSPNDGTSTRRLIRWNGSAWSPVTLPTENFSPYRIHGSGASDVWVVGFAITSARSRLAASVLHFDGTSWVDRSAGLDAAGVTLHSIWVESKGRIWAHGNPAGEAHSADIYRSDGVFWTKVGSLKDTRTDFGVRGAIAGAGGEVYVLASEYNGGSRNYLVRVSESPFKWETPQEQPLNYDGSMRAEGGHLWYLGANPYRRESGGWVKTTMPRSTRQYTRTPDTFAFANATDGWGFSKYGDIRRLSQGAWSYFTPEDKGAISGFAGGSGVPMAYGDGTYARTETPAANTGSWQRAALAGTSIRQVVTDAAGQPEFVVTDKGALLRRNAAGYDAFGQGVVRAALGAGNSSLWAISSTTEQGWEPGGASLVRWTGSNWESAPALPEEITNTGGIKLSGPKIEYQFVAVDGEDVWMAGGQRFVELENDYRGAICRLRSSAWVCRPVVVNGELGSTRIAGLETHAAGGIWVVAGAKLLRVDRETLGLTTIGLSTGESNFGAMFMNRVTGELAVHTTQLKLAVLRPATKSAAHFRVPISGYTGWLSGLFPAADGGLWVSGAQGVLRYRAP